MHSENVHLKCIPVASSFQISKYSTGGHPASDTVGLWICKDSKSF